VIAKAKRKPVESQFMAVSETEKYVAAEVETGAKVSHWERVSLLMSSL